MRDVRPEVVEATSEQVQPDPATYQMMAGPPIPVARRSLLGTRDYAAAKQSVALAKNWVRATFAGTVEDDTLYDLSLCVDELVDNGRKHGGKDGVISVAAYLTATTALLEVMNDRLGVTSPHVTAGNVTEEGHGLMIVAAVSARCGSYLDRDGCQVVWCEFPRRAASTKEISGNGASS